jgi:hypothetical protein
VNWEEVSIGHSIFQITECSIEMEMACLQQCAVSLLCDCRGNSGGIFCACGIDSDRTFLLITVER